VLFGSDVSALLRFEGDTTATVLGDIGGPHEAGARVTLDPGYVVDTVRRTSRSARFDTPDPPAADEGTLVRMIGVRSAVASPIVVEGALWGAITVASVRRPLAPTAQRQLTEFTELIATAIANAGARTELSRLAEEQAALRRVAELVARDSSSAEVFDMVTEEAWRVLETEAIGLLASRRTGRPRSSPSPARRGIRLRWGRASPWTGRTSSPRWPAPDVSPAPTTGPVRQARSPVWRASSASAPSSPRRSSSRAGCGGR
jgi:GAF domain-containing protein